MAKSNSASWKEIRSLLFDTLDARPVETIPVLRAIPLGFPIVEASYSLQERVPERIGLIRRYLLEAICRFGPCTSAQLDELLGLGEDIITRTLREAEDVIPGLTRNMDVHSASEGVRRLLDGDQFTRIVTHSRTFVINGLTGRLLPISFWDSHGDWKLYPSPENPEGLFMKASGEPTNVSVKIVDRAVTGREELQRVIESGDVMWRQEYGVPPGTCEVPSEPERIELSWVLAFLLLKADSTCELYSAHRSPVNLLDDATSDRDYLRQVCQSLKPWMLDTESARSHLQKWSDVVSESGEAGLGRTPGEVLVRLFDPDRTLRFEDSRTRGQDKTLTRLCQALLRGRVWDPYTCNLMRIVPGNAATASRTALIRGVYDLRSAIRPLVFAPGTMPSLNLVAWWDEWQRQYAQGLPQQSIPPRLTTATLLECADSLRDTEFLEKLEWFSAEHNLGHENG